MIQADPQASIFPGFGSGHILTLGFDDMPPASYSPNNRQHWTIRRGTQGSDDLLWDLLVKAALQKIEPLPEGWPMRLATVQVEFRFPGRVWRPEIGEGGKMRRDADNYTPRMKPVFDALVAHGVLIDDNIDVIGWPHYSHMYTTPKGITITIIESTGLG